MNFSVRGSDLTLAAAMTAAFLKAGLKEDTQSPFIGVWAGGPPPVLDAIDIWVRPFSAEGAPSLYPPYGERMRMEIAARGLQCMALVEVPHAAAMAPALQSPYYALALDGAGVLRMFSSTNCLIRFLTDFVASGPVGRASHA